MPKQSLLIIGAGASGLMAASRLAEDFDITILEAKDRTGGRIWTKNSPHTKLPIEAGAEFIHGHQPLTIDLLNKAGIPYTAVEGKMYALDNGQLVEETEQVPGWEELLHAMQQVKEDMSLQDFLEQYFGGQEHAALRQHTIGFAGGFDLADPGRASVRALYEEWSNEEEDNFRIAGGYGALINFLKEECERKGCHIVLNAPVRQVDWEKDTVTIYTEAGEKYFAGKLIITVPLAVLASSGSRYSINFTPPLREQEEALQQMGIGKVIKAVLVFKQTFWKKDAGFIFSNEAFPTWWTQLPDTAPVITGWAGGAKAAALEEHSDDELLHVALASLSGIFNIPVEELKNNLTHPDITNWQAEDPGLSGYSYDTLQTGEARKLLKNPVANTIYFCGEALYEGTAPGTVEAAMVSAKLLAEGILDE